jgi:regulator of replication initiation timing
MSVISGTLAATISHTLSIIDRLNQVNAKIKDAEFSNLLADLSLEIADLKNKLVGAMEENSKLKAEIAKLKSKDVKVRAKKRGKPYG